MAKICCSYAIFLKLTIITILFSFVLFFLCYDNNSLAIIQSTLMSIIDLSLYIPYVIRKKLDYNLTLNLEHVFHIILAISMQFTAADVQQYYTNSTN